MDLNRHPEAPAGLAEPPVWILRVVAESDGHHCVVVLFKLPQDVARPEAPTHAEDHRLGKWAAVGWIADPSIGQGAGEGRRIRMDPAPEHVLDQTESG